MIKLTRYKRQIFDEDINFNSIDDIISWFDTLLIPKRKPSNISKMEHSTMVELQTLIDEYKSTRIPQQKTFNQTIIMNKVKNQLRLSKEEYESVYLDTGKQPDTVKGKYAIYKHRDMGSYKKFTENVKDLELFFSELKSYHKKPLNNLIVEFVSSSDMPVPAKYKSGKKVIWINPKSKKVGNTKEEYGSLRYIVLHELGHKFLEENNQSWNISDRNLITTKYSERSFNTFSDEEIFAELFALSHWKNKYKQYKNQIEKFEDLIEY